MRTPRPACSPIDCEWWSPDSNPDGRNAEVTIIQYCAPSLELDKYKSEHLVSETCLHSVLSSCIILQGMGTK